MKKNLYSGYILKKNFPDQKSVSIFTDQLFQFIFPLVENEETFLLDQEKKANDLKLLLKSLIQTCLADCEEDNNLIINTFFNYLSATAEMLVKDAQFILDYDPAAKTLEEIILSYPGFYAIAIYRLPHILYEQNISILPRMMSEQAHSKTGVDINAGAKIGFPFLLIMARE